MADEHIGASVEEAIPQSAFEVVPQPAEPETPEQERAPDGTFKRKGGYLRKIEKEARRADAALAEANFWKAKAISEGHGELSDAQPVEEWRAVRDAQVRSGIPDSLRIKAVEIEPTAVATEKEGAEKEGAPKAEGEQPDAPAPFTEEEIKSFENYATFERRVTLAKRDPEFREVGKAIMASGAPAQFIDSLGPMLADLDDGLGVLKVLGKYPDILPALSQLSEAQRYLALQEISSELSGEEEVEERRSPAKPPAPINPVRKVAATATGLSDDLPVGEWRRRRDAQVQKRGGR